MTKKQVNAVAGLEAIQRSVSRACRILSRAWGRATNVRRVIAIGDVLDRSLNIAVVAADAVDGVLDLAISDQRTKLSAIDGVQS